MLKNRIGPRDPSGHPCRVDFDGSTIFGCATAAVAADVDPSLVRVQVAVGANRVLARITRKAWDALALAPGRPVWVQFKSAALVD